MAFGKISPSGGYFKGILSYILAEDRYSKDQEAKYPEIVLSYNLYGKHSGALAEEMRSLAQNRRKVKKPVMHFSISFKPGDQTPEAVRQEFILHVMEEMGITEENTQALIVQHHDRPHDHYHIVANRIGMDNTVVSDKFSKNHLELAIDKWEKEMGLDNDLAQTGKRGFTYDPESKKGYRYNKSARQKPKKELQKPHLEDKKEILLGHLRGVLEEHHPTGAEELKTLLAAVGVDYRYTENVRGLAGGSFRIEGVAIKGSRIGFKAGVLSELFAANAERKITSTVTPTAEDKSVISIGKEKESKELKEQPIENPVQINDEKQRTNKVQKNRDEDIKAKAQAAQVRVQQYRERMEHRLYQLSLKRTIQIPGDTDQLIREEMHSFNPNKNVWSTLRDQFGKYYEEQLVQKAEALNKERKDKLQQEGAFIYDLLTHSLRDPQVKNIEELEKQLTPKGTHIQWDLGRDSREGRLLFIHGKTEMRAEEIGIDSGWIKQSLARNRKISWRGDTIRKRNQLKTIRNSLKKNLSTAKAKDDENIRLLREYKERMKKYQEAQQKEFQLNIFGVKPLWGKKKDYNDALEKEREENPCPARPVIDENIKEEIEKLSEAVEEADQKILELPPIEELEECVKTLMMRTDDDRLKEKLRLVLSAEEETPVSILYRINDAVRKYIDRGNRWNLDDLDAVLYKIPVIAKRMDVWRREDLIKAILRKSEELQKLNPDYKGLSEENKRLLRQKDTPVETLSNLNGRLRNAIDDLILREEDKKEEVKQRRIGRRH